MTEWDDFVMRRSIKFEEFCKKNKISTAEDLIRKCSDIGVSPPTELKLMSLFRVVESNHETTPFEYDFQEKESHQAIENQVKKTYNKKKGETKK